MMEVENSGLIQGYSHNSSVTGVVGETGYGET